MKQPKDTKPARDNTHMRPNDLYPGVTIDTGDKDKDTSALQKERTKVLDNNPRDNN